MPCYSHGIINCHMCKVATEKYERNIKDEVLFGTIGSPFENPFENPPHHIQVTGYEIVELINKCRDLSNALYEMYIRHQPTRSTMLDAEGEERQEYALKRLREIRG